MSDIIINILEKNFKGPRYHNQSRSQITFDCPLCSQEKGMPEGDGKGNLEVNYEMRVFKCWACYQRNGMSGGLRKLLRWFANGDDIGEYDILVPPDEDLLKKNFKKHKERVTSLPKEFLPLRGDYRSHEFAGKCLYFLKRIKGVSDHLINKYNIGFADEGYYKNRMIIPSYDRWGNVNFFITRAFGNDKLKYLNPPADKSDIIFNEYFVKYDFPIYLVEGALDHIVTPNSIPLLGTEMNDKIFETLYENANSYIIVFLDGDASEDTRYIANELNAGRLEGRVKTLYLDHKYDPSDFYKDHDPRTFYKKLGQAQTI